MTEPENRSQTRSLIKVESIMKDSIDIASYITKEFDYIVKSDLYNHKNECVIYDLLRQVALDKQNKVQRPLILLSPDIATVSATISGSAERNMRRIGVTRDLKGSRVDGVDFESDLQVLYISSKMGLNIETYDGLLSYQRSVMSNAMGLTTQSFTKHNINVDPRNVIFLGVRSDLVENSEQNTIDSMAQKPLVFDLDRIRNKGIERVIRFVKSRFKGKKVHVVFDMSSIDVSLASSVFRFRNEIPGTLDHLADEKVIAKTFRGLKRDEILAIMEYVSELKMDGNLEEFDLVGYNFSTEEYRTQVHPSNVLTSKIMLEILKCVSDFSEQSINIFDENSKFLIWKKIPKVFTEEEGFDPSDDPKGWYILRNVDLNTRNELIAHFDRLKQEIVSESDNENDDETDKKNKELDPNSATDIDSYLKALEYPIERFEFPDGDDLLDVMISVTCPAEQKLKSYHVAQSYYDRCLMPGEKVNMTFELLSTPSTIRSLNQNIERFGLDENRNNTETTEKDEDLFEDIEVNNGNNDDSSEDSGIDPGDLVEYRQLYEQYQNVVTNANTIHVSKCL